MNKEQFLDEIIQISGYNKKTVEHIFNTTIDVASETLAQGMELRIRGFGTFTPKRVASRLGCNPKSLERITIPESKKIKFIVSKRLKSRLNG